MGAVVILIKSFVADYCNKRNRHQEKTMPETVFLFCSESLKKKLSTDFCNSFTSTAAATNKQ
jgi:hypothetical protein